MSIRIKLNNYRELKRLLLHSFLFFVFCFALSSCRSKSVQQPTTSEKVDLVVPVQYLQLNKELELPGQMLAYQDVPIHAKVEGFISWIGVDRGWTVKKGQKMITIYCPELE